ncbi:MAG TPA: cytoplasmic protein [Candidatus Thermoplasmatota archaeon]
MAPDLAPFPDPVTTDPDKYKVIFENERVRVFDYSDKPGDKTKMHHHKEFLLYALGPFKRRLTFPGGKVGVREFKGGEIVWNDEQSHLGENMGSTNTHVLIVEFKTRP